MVWLGLLALMLIVSAAPGISMYVEHLRTVASESGDTLGDGTQSVA
jgi:hypothetical protein